MTSIKVFRLKCNCYFLGKILEILPTLLFLCVKSRKKQSVGKVQLKLDFFDNVAFDVVYSRITETFPEIETIVADFTYKTSHICKRVFGDGLVLSTAYKQLQTMKGGNPCGSTFTKNTLTVISVRKP